MYGYDSADQIVGARLGDLLVEIGSAEHRLSSRLQARRFSLTDVETREVDRYGNTKYFLNNLTAIEEEWSLSRGWGTQRDITEQKRSRGSVARERRAAAPHYRCHSGRTLGD